MAKMKTWVGAEIWPLDKILPYPNNPRTHPPQQIDLLAKLLAEFGPDQPIVVDEKREILKGHGRRLAAIKGGLQEFPVFVRTGLSEEQKKAIRIADNQVALLSGWDRDMMRIEVAELQIANYDLQILGFDEKTLASYLPAQEPVHDPDQIPEPPARPIVRTGDLWEIGEHRILCGDSTDKAAWARLMGTDVASLVFTDPPYGVSYEAASGEFAVIEGDHKRRDDLYKMLVAAFKCMAGVAAGDAAFYIWHASSTRNDFTQAMTAAGIAESQYLIWAKPSISLGWGDYNWSHEPCFYAAKAGASPAFYGPRSESTVWRVEAVRTEDAATVIGPGLAILDGTGRMLYVQSKAPKSKRLREVRLTDEHPRLVLSDDAGTGTVWEVSRDSDYVHPTQKPVALATRAIENSSRPGEIVVDGFSGSGTTLIGCEMTARRARVIDIDPKYAQAAIERWQKFTGRDAMLEGQTFAQVAKARAGKGRRANAESGDRKPLRGGKRAARADRSVAE